MSLASTLNTTKSIFNNTSAQSAVVSTNIQNASNSDYNKRSASTTVSLYSGAVMLSTERAQNNALLKQTLVSTADNSAQKALLSGMESVSALLGGDAYTLAPSTYLATLRNKLKTYAETPGDVTLAQTVVAAAQDVANSLNNTSAGIQQLRGDADAEIATQVTKLNKLLSDFETANNEVIKKTAMGDDPNDAIDRREGLVKQISEIIGVSTYTRDGNDMALYTSAGTTLFETVARKISFTPTAAFAAGSTGSALYIDGVKVEAGDGASTTAKGSLPALLQLRDDVLPTIQDQLDEIARGLISLFSETDSSGGTPVQVAGLFTTKTGTAVAFDTADIIPGLAASITVSSAVVASPFKLRDGNISGTNQNTGSSSGFSDVLRGYIDDFDQPMAFDADSKLSSNVTLLNFSTDTVGWIEDFRSNATSASETKEALLTRATQAYSNSTGVNLDEELVRLLDIEQSYKAASKLLSTVDEMLQALLAAAG